MSVALPEWCCASGCRRCDAWREYVAAMDEADELAAEKVASEKRVESALGALRTVARGFGAKP